MHQCFPTCSKKIPKDQEIGSVTADGAYDTRKCHDAIADRVAHAVIPPRKNASHGGTSPPVRSLETRPCVPPNTLGARYGNDGADTTAGAASRRRCIVSNCWVSG